MQGRLLFFSLLYGMPAPSSESQLLEAWPASIYGHLREGYLSVPSQAGRNVPTCLGWKTILYIIQLSGWTAVGVRALWVARTPLGTRIFLKGFRTFWNNWCWPILKRTVETFDKNNYNWENLLQKMKNYQRISYNDMNCFWTIDQLSTQTNSTQPNWVKVDNDYWSVPPPPTTPPGTFRAVPDGLGQRNLGCNLIRP